MEGEDQVFEEPPQDTPPTDEEIADVCQRRGSNVTEGSGRSDQYVELAGSGALLIGTLQRTYRIRGYGEQ